MALSANTALPTRNRTGMRRHSTTILTAAVCYKHGLIVTTVTGKALPAANDTTTTFLGLCETQPSTGDGTVTVTTVTDLEVQITLATLVTVGNVGDAVYAVDDASATTDNTLGPQIGTLVEFTSANLGWVMLHRGVMSNAS